VVETSDYLANTKVLAINASQSKILGIHERLLGAYLMILHVEKFVNEPDAPEGTRRCLMIPLEVVKDKGTSVAGAVFCGRCERQFVVRIPALAPSPSYECPHCKVKQSFGTIIWD